MEKQQIFTGLTKTPKDRCCTKEPVRIYSQKKRIEGRDAFQVIARTKNSVGELEESSEIWVDNDLHVPPQFQQFLRMALDISEEFRGTPLQISAVQRDLATKSPHMVQALAAYKIVQMPMQADTFQKPTGFKEVASELNLMIDDETEKELF